MERTFSLHAFNVPLNINWTHRLPLDMVYEWQDMEVTFRVINKKGVDSEALYQLFPPPEAASDVPCAETLSKLRLPSAAPKALLSSSPVKPSSTAASNAVNSKSLQCNLCDRTFSKTSHLRSHLQSHPNSKPHKCEICGWGQQFFASIPIIISLTYLAICTSPCHNMTMVKQYWWSNILNTQSNYFWLFQLSW